MDSPVPTINGRAYDWASIDVVLFGKKVWGITEISYEEQKDLALNYGAGNKAVSYGDGAKTFSGSMTIEEQEAIWIEQNLPPGSSMTDIPPFAVIISFAPAGKPIVTRRLLGCRISQVSRTHSQGESNSMVELTLVVADIWYR
jgi:hypothetical protein